MLHFISIVLSLIILLFPQELKTVQNSEPQHKSKVKEIPPVIVYKTKRDYRRNVPVLLSDDKKSIVSYPHPTDLMGMTSNDVMPIRLNNGYLLDRKGINKNVAFLRFTYDSYKRMRRPLSIGDLKKNIIDKDPLLEIYNCTTLTGKENIVSDLNKAIDNNSLHILCQ